MLPEKRTAVVSQQQGPTILPLVHDESHVFCHVSVTLNIIYVSDNDKLKHKMHFTLN